MQSRHCLEQEKEVESEQVIAKEACISWKSRLEAAGLILFTVSRS